MIRSQDDRVALGAMGAKSSRKDCGNQRPLWSFTNANNAPIEKRKQSPSKNGHPKRVIEVSHHKSHCLRTRGIPPKATAIRESSSQQEWELEAINAIPDANAVVSFTTELDNRNAERRSRGVATRLHRFLESIQQFSTIVDTFVSSKPSVAALVWGSIKFALLVRMWYPTWYTALTLSRLQRTSLHISTKFQRY